MLNIKKKMESLMFIQWNLCKTKYLLNFQIKAASKALKKLIIKIRTKEEVILVDDAL